MRTDTQAFLTGRHFRTRAVEIKRACPYESVGLSRTEFTGLPARQTVVVTPQGALRTLAGGALPGGTLPGDSAR